MSWVRLEIMNRACHAASWPPTVVLAAPQKSDDTNKGPGKKKTWPPVKVDCLDVVPGDWLHIGHHMQMFRRWINGSGIGKKFVLYQMGGGWGKANAVVSTFSDKYGPCYRRPNIIDGERESDGAFCSTSAPVL